MDRCEKCPLHKLSQVNCLWGSGNLKADIMLVGEAPGAMEELYEKVFTGPAGQLLDRVLQKSGLNRDDLYITNVCKCRPKSSNKKENRTPKVTEINACRDYLLREIKMVHPKVIVPLGNIALKGLINKTGISNYRGSIFNWEENPNSIFDWKENPGIKIAPTFHPSALLRHFEDEDMVVNDFRRVKDYLAGRVEHQETNYIVIETKKQMETLFKRLNEVSIFSYDIETTGLDWSKDKIICISFSWKAGTAVCIPLLNKDGTDTELRGFALPLLSQVFDNETPKIAHNFMFDTKFLLSYGMPVRNNYFDTMLAHHLLQENPPHTLSSLAWKYTDMGGYDRDLEQLFTGHKKKKSYLDIPFSVLFPYSCGDSDCTFRLYERFNPRLKEESLESLFYRITMPLAKTLMMSEINGVKIDMGILQNLLNDYIEKIDKIEKKIFKLIKEATGKKDVNLNSPKQLRELFYDDLKLKLDDATSLNLITDGGEISTGAKALKILSKQHPIVSMIAKRRKLVKIQKTYIDSVKKWLDKDNRVHTSYLIHGERTGRTASVNPNLQNIPRDDAIRDMFVAKEGYKLISADYSQMELRILAHYSKDKKLVNAFLSGEDIHKVTASDTFGVPLNEVTKEQRSIQKTVNFGLSYGRGAVSLADELGISIKRADKYIRDFFNKYRGVSNLMERVRKRVRREKELGSLFGRKRRFPEIASQSISKEVRASIERQAINFPIQASASDILSVATIKLHNKFDSFGFNAHLVLTIHDALVYEVRDDQVDDAVDIIRDTMCNAVQGLIVPLDVDISVGEHWGSLKPVEK